MNGVKIVFCLLSVAILVSALKDDDVGGNYVVGGRAATRHQFPWIVSLRNTQNIHFCGGFILSDRWIGTAAHCTQGRFASPEQIIAATGAHTLTDGNRHRVIRLVNHPRYNRNLAFDVSILLTAERMPVTPQGPVRTIRFPTGPMANDRSVAYFAGWGLTQVRHYTHNDILFAQHLK